MDSQTIHTYNTRAAAFCADYRRATPAALYRLVQQHFHHELPTADIGCGSGRDTAWLTAHGYPTIGYDASPAMLDEARRAYPGLTLREAALPALATIPDCAYANVLCCAVLMHLPRGAIAPAVGSLARILRPGGRVLLSYRASDDVGERAEDGRLFTPMVAEAWPALLAGAGLRVRATAYQDDATRAGVCWLTLAGEREDGVV